MLERRRLCWRRADLLYLKDTKGTGKADVRQVVLTGFGKDKAGEGQLNSFHWTLDNRILVSTGLDGGQLKQPDGKIVSLRSMNVLLDPKTNQWELTSGGGQHGMSIDDFGRVYVSGNSDPFHTLAYDARYLSAGSRVQAPAASVDILPSGKFTRLHRISPVEGWRALRTKLRKEGKVPGSAEGGTPAGFFTGASGVTVYRGDAFPAEYRGNIFVGEVANNLVFRATLKPNGSLPLAERADSDREFLASKDVWFRPVQLANGPDGCLYVIDMYRELIEGAAFLAPQVLKNVDPSAGIDKGRIWRIVTDGYKHHAVPALGKAKTEELVDLLDHPNGWHRDTASRLLYQRQPHNGAIQKQLEQLVVKGKTAQGRVHALHALAPLAGKGDKLLKIALKDPEPRVREHALRLCESPRRVRLVRRRSTLFARTSRLTTFGICASTLISASGSNSPIPFDTSRCILRNRGTCAQRRICSCSVGAQGRCRSLDAARASQRYGPAAPGRGHRTISNFSVFPGPARRFRVRDRPGRIGGVRTEWSPWADPLAGHRNARTRLQCQSAGPRISASGASGSADARIGKHTRGARQSTIRPNHESDLR